MPNTSATGGYLASIAPQPVEGKALLVFLQSVIVGITGLDGPLVRPRWQAEPPSPPNAGTAWCAFGIVRRIPDTYAYVEHDPGDNVADPSDKLQRHETLELLASFYDLGVTGEADALCAALRDGLQIRQNREALTLAGMGLKEIGEPVTVPSLAKDRWQYRIDLPITIRRQIRRTYPILSIVSASVHLQAEGQGGPPLVVDTTINVTGP